MKAHHVAGCKRVRRGLPGVCVLDVGLKVVFHLAHSHEHLVPYRTLIKCIHILFMQSNLKRVNLKATQLNLLSQKYVEERCPPIAKLVRQEDF